MFPVLRISFVFLLAHIRDMRMSQMQDSRHYRQNL